MAFTEQELARISEQEKKIQAAQILDAATSAGFKVYSVVVDLSTARTEQDPLVISFPFKTIAFERASDNTVEVFVKFNSNDSGVSSVSAKDNAVFQSGKMFAKANLYWSAQSGKSIRVTVYLDTTYTSGSLINSGTIAVAPSGSFVASSVNTTTVTNALVIAQNTSRKRVRLSNQTGGYIYVQGSSAGTTVGYYMQASESAVFETTAALYAYPELTSTGGIKIVEEV